MVGIFQYYFFQLTTEVFWNLEGPFYISDIRLCTAYYLPKKCEARITQILIDISIITMANISICSSMYTEVSKYIPLSVPNGLK